MKTVLWFKNVEEITPALKSRNDEGMKTALWPGTGKKQRLQYCPEMWKK